jgi:ribosomal-protein-alanine N-acetyltransferase
MPSLRTDRLELTAFADEHLAELHALFTDAEVRRFLLDDAVVPREWVAEEIRASRDRFAMGIGGIWAVREIGSRPIAGFVGYRHFFEPPDLQLLYGFLPAYWRRGLAVEAAREAIRYGFEDLGLSEIHAAADAPNEASARVLVRLGFTESHQAGAPEGTRCYMLRRESFVGLGDRVSAGLGDSASAGLGEPRSPGFIDPRPPEAPPR